MPNQTQALEDGADTEQTGMVRQSVPPDSIGRRMSLALPVSLLVNLAFVGGASVFAHHAADHVPLPPAQLTLVTAERSTPNAKPVFKPLPKPTPLPSPTPEPIPTPHPTPLPRATPLPKASAPPPEGAHNRVLTAKPRKNAPPKSDDHIALDGGRARLGQTMNGQSAGNATTAPAGPTSPVAPVATPAPQPSVVPVVTPTPTPLPTPVPTPKPTPLPAPKPIGPTRPAEVVSADKPEIPDNLKAGEFKAFVRVRVEVDETGRASSVTLRTSSGNVEIDKRVSDVLKRAKYKPALQNGVPVASTFLFKYEFDVQ